MKIIKLRRQIIPVLSIRSNVKRNPTYNTNIESKKILIPRTFHLIWVGTKKNPNKEFALSWLKYHPGWTMRIWGNDDIKPENFVNFEYIMNAKQPAQKADIMRYEIMYKYGGVYVDTDFECFRCIEPIISGIKCFLCNEDDKLTNAMSIGIFGTTPGNPIFENAVKKINTVELNTHWINQTTGPFYFYKCLEGHNNEFVTLPSRYFYPITPTEYSQNKNMISFYKKAYGVHHWEKGASWLKSIKIDTNPYDEYKNKYYVITTELYPYSYYGGVGIFVRRQYDMLKNIRDVNVVLINRKNKAQYTIFDKMEVAKEIETLNDIEIGNNDIVIFHNPLEHELKKIFEKRTSKIYCYVHSVYTQRYNVPYKSICKNLNEDKINIYENMHKNYNYFDKIICVNPFGLLDNNKAKIWIPNIITPNSTANTYDATFMKLSQYKVKLIYIGRLQYYKGIHNLLELYKILKQKKNVSLTLVGKNIDNFDLEIDGVIHIPEVENEHIHDLIQKHDVYISLSLFEGFPSTYLEAGLASKCCIISNTPGMQNIFGDTVIYTDNYEDPTKLSEELDSVLDNDELMISKGRSLHNLILTNYSEKQFEQYLRVLEL